MLFDDTYKTIEKPAGSIFRDRGSKFLGYAYPINSENDIKAIIANLKAEHPKANHHCWAMRLSIDRSVFRINDDGEPSGTAGRPILNTLLSHDLTNIAVVVVRYFGGTLLGVPGLINAYKTTAEEAIKQAVIVHKTVNDIYTITFDYLQMNDVMRIIKDDILNLQHKTHSSELKTYTTIVSNPPYVTLDDKKQMHSNVTDFEPHTALFVPEHDPLIFYRAITGFAQINLKPEGLLFFEINENYGNETIELLSNKGFKDIELRKDMSGRDRMIKATIQ